MLAGKPIVSAFSGYQTLLNESKCGLFVKSEDFNGLAKNIEIVFGLSKKERQEMGQVSELEATLATSTLPQARRILDPSLAVAKYRRSAAAGALSRKKRHGSVHQQYYKKR